MFRLYYKHKPKRHEKPVIILRCGAWMRQDVSLFLHFADGFIQRGILGIEPSPF